MEGATSHRLRWQDVPLAVRSWIEAGLGSAVVTAEGQAGGYGPGVAARCRLADGRRVFLKAVSSALNPDTPAMVREEAVITAGLGAAVPAPRLLDVFDDGTWVVLVFEEVAGRHPALPWRAEELGQVLRASLDLCSHRAAPTLPTVAERFGPVLRGWRTLAGEGGAAVGDDWARRHLDDLAALEAGWEAAAGGDALVHGDVRSDNVLLVGASDVVFVDWAHTSTGADWFDAVNMAPSVQLEGGGSHEEVLRLAGLHLDVEVLAPVVAAMAGYFTERGRLPDPPGLPTLRAFQRAQAEVTLAWLRRLWPRS